MFLERIDKDLSFILFPKLTSFFDQEIVFLVKPLHTLVVFGFDVLLVVLSILFGD